MSLQGHVDAGTSNRSVCSSEPSVQKDLLALADCEVVQSLHGATEKPERLEYT